MSEAALAVNHYDAEKEKPRKQSLVEVKLRNRNTLNLAIETWSLGPGEHTITLYKSQVPGVLAMVERDNLRMVAAQDAFMAAVTREVGELMQWQRPMSELRELVDNKSDPNVNEKVTEVLESTSLSMEAEFQKLAGRSLLPLESAEEVPGSAVPEPQRANSHAEQEKLVSAFTAAVAPQFQQIGSALEMLAKLLAAQQQQRGGK